MSYPLKRWWYFEKPTSLPNPIARSAEHTVRLPVQISVPSRSVRAFFQEGFEKSTEKGSKTDKMLWFVEAHLQAGS